MENAGKVLSRTRILNHVWGYSFDPGSKVVDVYIRYLRQKIDDGEAVPLIQTVRGFGYTDLGPTRRGRIGRVRRARRRISSSVTPSGRLSSAIVPPCFSTIHLAIDRPRPLPPVGLRVPAAVEAVEHVGQVLGRDRLAAVAHPDDGLAVLGRAARPRPASPGAST